MAPDKYDVCTVRRSGWLVGIYAAKGWQPTRLTARFYEATAPNSRDRAERYREAAMEFNFQTTLMSLHNPQTGKIVGWVVRLERWLPQPPLAELPDPVEPEYTAAFWHQTHARDRWDFTGRRFANPLEKLYEYG